MQAAYRFKTIWHINAPLEKVWSVIYRSEDWPLWWPAVKQAQILERRSKNNGIGSITQYVVTGASWYTLTFSIILTKLIPYQLIEGRASGDLEGVGTWHFSQEKEITIVQYDWDVALRKPWLRLFSPLVRPFYMRNHDHVMQLGESGLRHFLRSQHEIV